jgi:hypothetical protein
LFFVITFVIAQDANRSPPSLSKAFCAAIFKALNAASASSAAIEVTSLEVGAATALDVLALLFTSEYISDAPITEMEIPFVL